MAAASKVLERSVTAVFVLAGAWAVWSAWADAPPSHAGDGPASALSGGARSPVTHTKILRNANEYQARLYLDEARKYRQTEPRRALDLYNQAWWLDRTNPAASDGRKEMSEALGLDVGTRLPGPRYQHMTRTPQIQFDFDMALADANTALRTGDLAAAEKNFGLARAAAAADPGIFSSREIGNQNRRLADLRSRIDATRDAVEAYRRCIIDLRSRAPSQDQAATRP